MTEGMKQGFYPTVLASHIGPDSIENAVREGRCLRSPRGCGEGIKLDRQKRIFFPNATYREKWKKTGLCSNCQDVATAAEDGDYIVRGLD